MSPERALSSGARVAVVLLLAGIAFASSAAPRVPDSDQVVLERLPSSPLDGELETLRRTLHARPRDLKLASTTAWKLVLQARRLGDPRYLGYAQAVLRPWWQQPLAPTEVLLVRATIRQNRHQFDAAIEDLERVLEREPGHVNARLTLAVVQVVTGSPRAALESCSKLVSTAGHLVRVACHSLAAGHAGDLDGAYRRLVRGVARDRRAAPSLRAWSFGILADIAYRMGHAEAARQHLVQAIALDADDRFVRLQLADLMLAEGQLGDVESLLAPIADSDAALLRRALAAKRQDDERHVALSATLQRRFDEQRRRGDSTHRGAEARYLLHLRAKPYEALQAAIENWALQREPADARILLESALASKDIEAAMPVLDWMRRTGIEDVHLEALVQRFRLNGS